MKTYVPAGVIPAVLMAFHDDLSIDEPNARKHLRDVAAVPGLSAITVNAHAAEVHALTFDEQQRILDFSLDEVGSRIPLIAGVFADGSLEAARIARMAQKAGAAAVLIFPPHSMSMGWHLRPEMARAHFATIAAATDLPLILFQYPARSGLNYPFETLLQLCDEFPTIRAIKDWCYDPPVHERQIRTLQSLPRPVTVLTTHTAWLMASLAMGAGGLLSGAGSVIADLQVALFEAIRAEDLHRARELNDRILPMTQAFYADPFLDMHNRMKECLVLLGRLPKAVVRPPLAKLPPAEIERLRAAIKQSRLGRQGALSERGAPKKKAAPI
ncbi:MAG: dihydrodipicolinate synthase family protein [Thermoguttaceae bacterium]|jgi:4-hydroxy-tetrahydrodipicolinate synthase